MKTKTLVTWLGLAGLVGLTSGCETPEGTNAALLTLAGAGLEARAMNAGSLREAAGASALSHAAYALGQQQAELDAAKQGRSEININLNSDNNSNQETVNQPNPQAQTEYHFFACNYWKDFNNNGMADYPDEFVGIKTKFRKNEYMVLCGYLINNPAGDLITKIYNSKGNEIDTVKDQQVPSNTSRVIGGNFDFSNWLIERGGLGTYKAVWYLNNNFIGSTEFELTE